jgi:superfamily II DNA or RNA helicase
MSLTAQFSSYFDDAIQYRGTDYFRSGRVRIDSVSDSRIVAVVHGSGRYRVELERAGRNINASCNCPYYDVDLCKHIWAVMLAVEKEPLLQGNALELVHKDVGDDDFDSEFDAPVSDPQVWLAAEPWPATRELLYVIDAAGAGHDALDLEVLWRDRDRDDDSSKPKPRQLRREWQHQVPDDNDRQILAVLAGATPIQPGAHATLPYRHALTDQQARLLLPLLCLSGRCHLSLPAGGVEQELGPPLTWSEGQPWQLRLEVRRSTDGDAYEMCGALWRGEERMDLRAPAIVTEAGILCMAEWVARYDDHGAFAWIAWLRKQGPLRVPVAQSGELLAELLRQPRLPPLDLPEELRFEEVAVVPRSRLTVKPQKKYGTFDLLHGELSFDYDGVIVPHGQAERGTVQIDKRRILLRDFAAEQAALKRLQPLGWRWDTGRPVERKVQLELASHHLPAVVRELTAEGWHVEALGHLYRSAGQFDIQVGSGVDWFELRGAMEFGDTVAELPDLLAALRRGEKVVRLGDGSFGVLPEAWLKQYGMLAGIGNAHGDHVRFRRSQAGLIDALLAAEPEARCDAQFARVREELRSFAGIQALAPPAGFKGELRPYQGEALGWFDFLRRFGFGGCLADDMGLGKTVQVLALLEARRELRARGVCPSLAVVPKSLIFNWKQEAARFAPRLRVLDHTGNQRARSVAHFADYDLILTTYGTLRNDALAFKDLRFDYLILDEAQAIKNADSVSAKSARLIKADHRLALSGTPIENHLGELWSLFEFLNPGMLGAASVFKMTEATRNPDEDTRKLLARALRPFLLRRTKEQVLCDLPPKVEQTLFCELDTQQRARYDELREYYRATLLNRVRTEGIGRAKIQILEALLRLRQAAIHPGLLDKQRVDEPSAKLDVLLPRVLEVIEEGHKTLIFSQFTGMLAILRRHLDRQGVTYEYLDGKTRDREACVARFQTDPSCRLFLVSLKAGGVGLNLTAAEYVFVLDPWWNPAVEAQAIGRAHRIGQTNRVFAYRLIARDTVEEKVIELQDGKRALADAIIGANEALIRNMGPEDLELLLS